MPIITTLISAIMSIFGLLTQYLNIAAITGLIARGIAYFFTAKGLTILAGLGLGYSTYVGIDILVDRAVAELLTVMGVIQSQAPVIIGGAGTAFNWAGYMLQMASYAGLFDAIEILLAGFLVANSMGTAKLILNKVMPT